MCRIAGFVCGDSRQRGWFPGGHPRTRIRPVSWVASLMPDVAMCGDRGTGYKQRMTAPQDQIAGALSRSNRAAAAAESLTGGNVSAALSAIEGASSWFLGGVVAYAETVKFDLLGVHRGPVVNAETAHQMATGVAELLGADFAVATTGV